jgi:5,10-methylene-tetrahydrofolate dehydrogenase/methenyl tetrahydrofolate cyclohydrolase
LADHDIIALPQPQLPAVNKRSNLAGRPTIAALKTALATVNGGTSYTADRLASLTYNDLVHACRVHGLSVTVSF